MIRLLAARWPEAVLLTAAALLLLFQVFVPPFIGIGNNGDFSKVCMQLCLGPVEGWGDNFKYFETLYTRKPNYCWKSDMRVTEFALAWVAYRAAGLFGRAEPFDIRWMGLVHSLLLLGALALFLRMIRPLGAWAQWGLGAAAIWMFFDVRYVAYMNSFYMDTPAFLGAYFVAMAAVHVLRAERPSISALLLFGAAVVFFALSKSAHGINAWIAAALPVAMLFRTRELKVRAAAVAVAALCVGVAIASVALTPKGYKGQALYNVIFYKILGESSNRAADAELLGVRAEEVSFTGTNAFTKNSPGRSLSWVMDFYNRTGFSRVLRYYLAHPDYVVNDVWDDLTHAAPVMRSPGISNYRKVEGYPPGTLTDRFGSWTALRSALYRAFPAHILIWFGALLLASVVAIRKRPQWRGYGLLAIGFTVAAGAEFGVASLADAVETDRHLYIFHTLTDVTLLGAAVALVSGIQRMRRMPHPQEVVAGAKHSY